jgi:cytochrome c-type biogenesis protein CcmE
VIQVTHRRFLVPAIAAIVVLVALLAWNGLGDNLVYYLTPTEAVDQRSDFPDGERFRLGGLVLGGTLAATPGGVTFLVGDGATSVRVVHHGTPPQLFQEDVGVVVEGAWTGDEFASDLLLVRHDENYRSPDGPGPYRPPVDEAGEG